MLEAYSGESVSEYAPYVQSPFTGKGKESSCNSKNLPDLAGYDDQDKFEEFKTTPGLAGEPFGKPTIPTGPKPPKYFKHPSKLPVPPKPAPKPSHKPHHRPHHRPYYSKHQWRGNRYWRNHHWYLDGPTGPIIIDDYPDLEDYMVVGAPEIPVPQPTQEPAPSNTETTKSDNDKLWGLDKKVWVGLGLLALVLGGAYFYNKKSKKEESN